MSSLTDIIFLLLIFFMLTSTLVSVNALKLILPTSDSKTLDKQTIAVSINDKKEYFVEKEKVTLAQMESILKRKIKGEDNPTIVLNAEKSVPIDNVVQVMNVGYNLNVSMILATQQK